MKVAFFGTPDFAKPSLKTLAESEYEVVGVVTAPNKPRGRGRLPAPTAIAIEAEILSLPILKPISLKDRTFLDELRKWNADIFVVVAFRILPEEVFGMASGGSINLHASLLPAYRGAAPIQWALWNGETTTGLTTFQIEKKVDTGNILLQRQVQIGESDDAGSLSEKLSLQGASLLLETIDGLESGMIKPQRQDTSKATPAPKITDEHTKIDWNRSASEIRNQIRALSPKPGAFTRIDGQTLKIFRSEIIENKDKSAPGSLTISDDGIVANTGDNKLKLTDIQLQGKKRMETSAFLRGYRLRGTFKIDVTGG
ncbi:methionyl-tRNA formyltransferase [candidate division LCP-89 bacterium B3_LCP]|uniref:Methionyl-tRNA formyltransferase n=1 Tax=candidate division LCP-89 bacterium B3_LCP TaxID=2012998 RepID=A0A532V3J8_UNCL8|nr:MAG: methionyl-tRNA formyltransferase [candidate division LCP-89 bacterium B3_LCP]